MSNRGGQLRRTLALAAQFSPYMRDRRGRLALIILAALAVMFMKLLEPWPIKLIIDIYFFGLAPPVILQPLFPEDPTGDNTVLVALIVSIVVIAALSGFFYYLQRLLTSSTALEATSALRVDVYTALHNLPIGFHDRQRLGEMLYRVTGDVRALRTTFVSLPVRVCENLFLIIGVLAFMLYLDWQLTLVGLALLPGLGWTTRIFSRPIRRVSAIRRAREGAISSLAVEALGGVRQIQAYNAEAASTERFRVADKRSMASTLQSARLSALLRFWSAAILGLGTALLVGYAAIRITSGLLTPGDLVVFIVYLRTFYGPLQSLATLTTSVSEATVAAERVAEILNISPEIAEDPDAERPPRFEGAVAFENVSLAYAGNRPALDRVDLKIEAGERVILAGHSGAGKTSIASLLPRFYDPDTGTVRIDGEDIRRYRLLGLRSRMSILFQEPLLFSMSVADNIAYGAPDATPEEIEAAVAALELDPVIEELADGLETEVGEGGRKLSGGQRQCVAILRAMVRDTPIVILDEPTSSLDPALKGRVLKAIDRLSEGRTVLVITHDSSVVRPGDRVVTMADGRIVSDWRYNSGDRLDLPGDG